MSAPFCLPALSAPEPDYSCYVQAKDGILDLTASVCGFKLEGASVSSSGRDLRVSLPVSLQVAQAAQKKVAVSEILVKRVREPGLKKASFFAEGQIRNDSDRMIRLMNVVFEVVPSNTNVTINGRRRVIDTKTVTLSPLFLRPGETASFETKVAGKGVANVLSVEWIWNDGKIGRQ